MKKKQILEEFLRVINEEIGSLKNRMNSNDPETNVDPSDGRFWLEKRLEIYSRTKRFVEDFKFESYSEVGVGSLVKVEEGTQESYWIFILPALCHSCVLKNCRFITEEAPLARTLIKKKEGDVLFFKTPGGVLKILKVLQVI